MSHRVKVLELGLNVLAVAVAVLALGVTVKRFVLPWAENGGTPGALRVGESVAPLLPGVDWRANHSTLVMALSVGCPWCRQSAGFYRRLLRANSRGAFRAVALFPQAPAVARAYLSSLQITGVDVRRADFGKLGVQGTPTLIIVNDSGRIRAAWVGALSPPQEAQVFGELGLGKTLGEPEVGGGGAVSLAGWMPGGAGLITAAELVHLRNAQVVPVVDVRPRADYARGHIAGSLNIPLDELEIRAPHELPKDDTIVAYCDYCPPCEARHLSAGILTYCTAAVVTLQAAGFSHIKVLSDDLQRLRLADVRITGAGASRSSPISTEARPQR